jgi:hypothetical protein
LNSFDYDYLIKAKPLTSFISELKKLYWFKDAYENLSENDYLGFKNALVWLNILFPFYKTLSFDNTGDISPDYDLTQIWKEFILFILEDEKA